VTKVHRYEPDLNETLADFASHYGTCIFAARSRKPRDKALVESAVSILYRRIYAPLRDGVFHSLFQLNEVISQLLEEHNQMLLQGKDFSRRSRFEEVEKATLESLPSQHYQLRSFSLGKSPS
jgi:transposase